MMNWRNVLLLGALITALPWLTLAQARAQESYPSRPIRLVIPSVPGGVHDVIGRLWAERVKALLGTIVIDNRGGGGGVIGANDVAHSLPDGYSILLGSTSTQVLSPAAMAEPPYDPMMSFTGVSVFSFSSTSIVVNPTAPVHSLKELIDYAKANPGKLSYGSAGNGSITNMAGELFKRLGGGLDIVHIPYKGIGQGVTDLISGIIPMFSANATAQILDLARAGKVRILAVNAAERIKAAPEIPTSNEAGLPGMVAQTTFAIFAPVGTPAAIVARLDAATQKVMADEDFQKQLLKLGFEPVRGVGGEKATEVFRDELVRWTPILKAGGVKAE
jgi:tripartite-type tricarboxylate transporter receptor subunit TctC